MAGLPLTLLGSLRDYRRLFRLLLHLLLALLFHHLLLLALLLHLLLTLLLHHLLLLHLLLHLLLLPLLSPLLLHHLLLLLHLLLLRLLLLLFLGPTQFMGAGRTIRVLALLQYQPLLLGLPLGFLLLAHLLLLLLPLLTLQLSLRLAFIRLARLHTDRRLFGRAHLRRHSHGRERRAGFPLPFLPEFAPHLFHLAPGRLIALRDTRRKLSESLPAFLRHGRVRLHHRLAALLRAALLHANDLAARLNLHPLPSLFLRHGGDAKRLA